MKSDEKKTKQEELENNRQKTREMLIKETIKERRNVLERLSKS